MARRSVILPIIIPRCIPSIGGPRCEDRITVTLDRALLEALDAAPGDSRSEKVERLLAEALVARSHRRWVSELRAFYKAGPDATDRQEDLDWTLLKERLGHLDAPSMRAIAIEVKRLLAI